MLKWIGIEKALIQSEQQKESAKSFLATVKAAGIEVRILDTEEEITKKPEASEGLLICSGTNKSSFLEKYIRRLPIVGLVEPGAWGGYGLSYVVEGFQGLDVTYLDIIYHRFHGIALTIAVTERMVIREITPEDVPKLYQAGISIRNPNDTEEFSLKGVIEEVDYVRAYIENMYSYYQYGVWILCKPNQNLLGVAGYDHIESEKLPVNSKARKLAENGFCLQAGYHICYNYRRQGYALEALNAVVTYGFQSVGVEEVLLLIEPYNKPSLKLAAKAGFSYMETVMYKGKTVKVYRYERSVGI